MAFITKRLKLNSTSHILFRSIVTPFYKQIAGALYFLFFVLFGIQPNIKQALDTHYYILQSIASNPTALSLFAILCLVYLAKCIVFYANRTSKNDYLFLQVINGIPAGKRIPHFVFTALMLLCPVLLYTLGIAFVCIWNRQWYNMIAPAGLSISLLVVLTLSLNGLNRNPTAVTRLIVPKIIRLPSRIWKFMISYIFREQFLTLIILKLLSFCCLYFFVITDASVFEGRMLWLIYSLCLAGHCMIIYKTFYFLENKLPFYRTLPIRSIHLLASFFLSYTILLLPEFWALRTLAVQHRQIYEYSCMIFAGPAFLSLLHVLLYTDDFKMDGYLSVVFLVWILFFFLSFAENKWLLPIAAIAGMLIVFYTSFRNFEKKSTIEKLE